MSFKTYIANVEAKTGQPIEALAAAARDKGYADDAGLAPGVKAGQLVDWLKADHGLGHGHAMSVVAWLKGKRD